MKLPWKKDDVDADDAADTTVALTVDEAAAKRRYTEAKGRPTPKRRDAEGRRRGPVAPAPTTRAEARARKKELKGSSANLSKEEKKAQSDTRRRQRADQREKMMDGEERYLMPRDKGEARRFARDIVDSRRNFAGLFMPFAIMLIIVMFVPAIAVYATLLMLIFVIFLVIDGVLLGRILNNRVRERFPSTTDGGFKLGWYGFSRAMQMRFMRAPRPKVKPGDAV
ncbi:DUF3043 domain-containing protein [Williamsia soli]|uniref:DUF3043 domain-containing protein n=1 Tax=Williamsia soli TaxID=364929 RepID=UPI001A9ECF17|nr:DUF3043 domain-containing protein [Williamsia soli]